MAVNKDKIKGLFLRTDFSGAVTEGGVPSFYFGKINGFLKLGHECCYVSSVPMILPFGVKFYYVPYNKFLRNLPEVLNLPYNEKSIKETTKIIEKEKPDFLYQHNHDFSYSGAILKKKLGIPFILHVDSVEYWIKKNWGKLYFKKLLKEAEEIQWEASDAITVPSQLLKEQLIDLGVDGNKIVVCINGVDPSQFSPAIDGSKICNDLHLDGKFVCGFAGTFGQWHGVEVLAKAVKYIVKLIPNAIVLFVGDGVLRPKIEEIIKQDNVEDKVIITGMQQYPKIPEFLAACDVLLSPCVNSIGTTFFNSPIKLFEYMGMGKPIIATDVGQQGDVIHDNVNGLICPEQDPEALAVAIKKIHDDKDLAARLGIAARKDALEKYDWKHHSQLIVDAYWKIKMGK
jgi:glycosyltransferase involved in cell wall biosynthesis